MATFSMPRLPTLETETNRLSQQLTTYVWKNFRYAMQQSDIEEFMFTDTWHSLDDFIRYMQQDGIGIGEPIPGTMNYTPPPSARLFNPSELDSMDSGLLPSEYGFPSTPASPTLSIETYLEDDDYEDSESIFTDYAGEPLPLYEEDKPPVYPSFYRSSLPSALSSLTSIASSAMPSPLRLPQRPPLPSPPPLSLLIPPPSQSSPYKSHFSELFDFEDVGVGNTAIDMPRYLEDPPPALNEETKPQGESKHRLFSQIRPRLVGRLQRLKHEFSHRRKKQPTVKEKPPGAPQDGGPEPGPGRKTRNLAARLRDISPKRVMGRAASILALGLIPL